MIITEFEEILVACQFCKRVDKRETLSRYGIKKPKKWAHHIGGSFRQPLHFFICDTCSKEIAHGTETVRS